MNNIHSDEVQDVPIAVSGHFNLSKKQQIFFHFEEFFKSFSCSSITYSISEYVFFIRDPSSSAALFGRSILFKLF